MPTRREKRSRRPAQAIVHGPGMPCRPAGEVSLPRADKAHGGRGDSTDTTKTVSTLNRPRKETTIESYYERDEKQSRLQTVRNRAADRMRRHGMVLGVETGGGGKPVSVLK